MSDILSRAGKRSMIISMLLAGSAALLPGIALAHDPQQDAQLEILGDSCEASELDLHDGFQNENAVCVDTEFGEQSAFENNPTLLIVDFPRKVKVGEDITLRVSTRNLIRDRFLAAGDGGYYLESAFLTDGLTRGHFHSGCRILSGEDEAPEPFRLGEQFVATEDGGGGADPDVVEVVIPGFDEAGEVQCASWAGDGSHRIPMMSFANVVPAFDAVRIEIKGGGDDDEDEDDDD